MNPLSSTGTPRRPDDASNTARSEKGPIISACVPAEAWFMHITEVDSYSTGNARVTETSYRRFTKVFTPESGPVGCRWYDTSFRCPYCQTDLYVQLTVRTCLQYSRQEFRSAAGRRLQKFLLARQLREVGITATIAPLGCGLVFGVLGGIVSTFSPDKAVNFRNGVVFGFGMGLLIVLGLGCHALFKLLLASKGNVSISNPRDIPPNGLEMVKVFVEKIDFRATGEMREKNKFHSLLAKPPKPNSEDRFADRVELNQSF